MSGNIIHKNEFNMTEANDVIIRNAKRDEWEEAMSLAWRVFRNFDAKDYTERGVKSFLEFISDSGLHRMFLIGEYKLFVAECKGKIVGVSSLRTRNHISLLFVDGMLHKRGIGRKLINHMVMHVIEEEHLHMCTVNAAPYAVPFYEKVGFKMTGPLAENDGIVYYPMQFDF